MPNKDAEFVQGLSSVYGANPRHELNEILLDAITVELSDTEAKDIPEILAWMISLRLSGLHMFFSPAQFVKLGDEMGQNLVIRRFALSLTERVAIGLSITQSFRDRAIYDLSASIVASQTFKHNEKSLIAKDVAASLTIQPDELSDLVHGNPWLSVIYLCLLTGMFTTATLDYAKEAANVANA